MKSMFRMFEVESKIDGVCANQDCPSKQKVCMGYMAMMISWCVVDSNSPGEV